MGRRGRRERAKPFHPGERKTKKVSKARDSLPLISGYVSDANDLERTSYNWVLEKGRPGTMWRGRRTEGNGISTQKTDYY